MAPALARSPGLRHQHPACPPAGRTKGAAGAGAARGARLRGPAGRVHEADGARADVVGLQRAREQLVVRAVDGVAALEGQHVLARRQRAAHLRTRAAPPLGARSAPGSMTAERCHDMRPRLQPHQGRCGHARTLPAVAFCAQRRLPSTTHSLNKQTAGPQAGLARACAGVAQGNTRLGSASPCTRPPA
jgi:hypothetical protein